ncbi:hypothetical protein WA158_001658 [Blastocystis sp. Blastoise]
MYNQIKAMSSLKGYDSFTSVSDALLSINELNDINDCNHSKKISKKKLEQFRNENLCAYNRLMYSLNILRNRRHCDVKKKYHKKESSSIGHKSFICNPNKLRLRHAKRFSPRKIQRCKRNYKL